MLSSNDVSAIGAEFTNLLGATCTIQRLQTASDSMGGQTSTWQALSTPACNVAPLTAPKNMSGTPGEQVHELAERVVSLPAGTDVTRADQIVVGSETFEVVDVREPRTYEFIRRAYVRLI